MNNEVGTIFDIQRYSIHDGPGIRTTVFLKGCPLKCLWCSNPESQRISPELMLDRTLCTGCGKCVQVCPHQATCYAENAPVVRRDLCRGCGECVTACPHSARQIAGREETLEKILNEIEKDRLFYKNSGGGVTLSGGEPMNQLEFTRALLKQCKERGIHTVLDTSGYTALGNWDLVLDYVDLILFDLKQMAPEKHQEYTGFSNEMILTSARALASRKAPMIIRIPLIPGYTDLAENIDATAHFAHEIGTTLIELLPFHRLCISKYHKLDKEWKLDGIPSPTKSLMEQVQQRFVSYGLNCTF